MRRSDAFPSKTAGGQTWRAVDLDFSASGMGRSLQGNDVNSESEKYVEARKSLLAELERIVGNQTYNAKIQNWGPSGSFLGEGREYRYPVTLMDAQGQKRKIYGKIDSKVSMQEIQQAYYGFGANNLHIGLALQRVLTYLEENYDLDIARKITSDQ